MALLCFIYLTLPNCAGKLLKTLSNEEKQEKSTKRQKDEFTRLKLASHSQWRVASANKSKKAHLLASNLQWRVIKEPAEAEAQFYSPWRVH